MTSATLEDTDLGAMAPLRNATFRMLWVAWLAANISLWMHDVSAAWLMTTLTTDPRAGGAGADGVHAADVPARLPSGALADIVDRRRYFAGTQLWAAAIALLLMALSLAGALSAPLLLLLTFLNGITMAMRWPVFAAIVPALVPRSQLSAALGLNGAAMNVSRIVGPAIAGAILASSGSALVFALNAVVSVAAFFTILRWRSTRRESALPGERFVGAMRSGLAVRATGPAIADHIVAHRPVHAAGVGTDVAAAAAGQTVARGRRRRFQRVARRHRPRRGDGGGVHGPVA